MTETMIKNTLYYCGFIMGDFFVFIINPVLQLFTYRNTTQFPKMMGIGAKALQSGPTLQKQSLFQRTLPTAHTFKPWDLRPSSPGNSPGAGRHGSRMWK
jgi:hypothetical protein